MGFDPESGNGGGSKFTPPPLITAFYHVTAQLYMSEIATVLGESADAAKYAAAHTSGQKAWHARFYDAEVGGYAPCLLVSAYCTTRAVSRETAHCTTRKKMMREAECDQL
jgi:hypothetical protein